MKSPLTTADHRPLARESAADQILHDLRERILSGELSRGDKLPTEREMALNYGVSGATVREAIRALVTINMVEVRHGSGAYVTADAGQLIAQSLRSMIKLENVSLPDILGVLSVLNAHAAEMAASRATDEDVAAMRAALDLVENGASVEAFEVGLKGFLDGLAEASHNPLLKSICIFLSSLQIDVARQIARGSVKRWRETTAKLVVERRRLVDAIARHDAAKARALALEYHRRAAEVLGELK